MEPRSNTPRTHGTASTVIQRPPISRVARPRESFPGKLIVPNIQTQRDVPSVNVIPPPALLHTYSHHTSTDIHHHQTDGPGRLDVYTPAHHLRHPSVSSYATQYSQRTQSTLQVIPTRTSKQQQRGKAWGVRAGTPIQFFRRGFRRSSTPGGDHREDRSDADDYELESHATESTGFHYAATPSIANTSSSRDPDLQAPLHVRYMQPSLAPTSEGYCMNIRVVGGINFFEGLAKRVKRAGRNVQEWKISKGVKESKGQNSIGGIDLYTDRGKVKAAPQAAHRQNISGHGIPLWGPGAKTLRIKNSEVGSCVFVVTTAPGNPQEIIEIPLSLKYLQSQLFVHSKTLIRALEDWNKHFQNPPRHWIINFVPKAYLRRGWHLAEEVAQYLRTYGLNAGAYPNGSPRSAWKVEYEAIGHKACLVDEDEKPSASEGYRTGKNTSQNLLAGVRERHPSMCWERKEGWEGCKGLVIGLAI